MSYDPRSEEAKKEFKQRTVDELVRLGLPHDVAEELVEKAREAGRKMGQIEATE